jgi:pyocin large subunit-like protein
MNLYILENVLHDYTSGMAVIAAETKDAARVIWIEEFSEYHAKDFDEYAEFKVIEGVNHPAGMVSYVFGGG